MTSPSRTYARLSGDGRRVSWVDAARRPVLVALVIGSTAAIASTGHVTAGLVLTTTVAWSFVTVLQVAIAAAFLAGPARREPGLPTALDHYFAGHGPWSLWMLGCAVWALVASAPVRHLLWVEASAVLPALWTAWILHAFHRAYLRLTPRVALRRTLAHQAVTWGIVLAFFSVAVQLWPRVLQAIGR